MMHTQLSILAVEHPLERRAFAVSSALVAILFFAYLYFVAASVLNIVARKEADAHATNLQSSIGALEENYFELAQSMTPQLASEIGLAPVAHTAYVYRPGNAASAQLPRRNEI